MNTKIAVIAVATLVGGLTASLQAFAHHSFAAEFDGDKKLDLHGVVTKVDWTNPHTYFYLEVQGKKGLETWALEMGSPNGLMRRGWTKDTLAVGTEVIVAGRQARDGTLKGNAQSVILADTCKRLFAGSSQVDFVEDESAKVEGCTKK
ncbi:MAG: DUF6152 family protein [Gammaproteobacteria bacterium]|jgi:hypothetical protein